jgi:hypothetical protein
VRRKTGGRSPTRSAPPPWRGRADRAGPSAMRASLPGPPRPATEPRRQQRERQLFAAPAS